MSQFYSNYYNASGIFHGSMFRIMGTRFDFIIHGLGKDEAESLWHRCVGGLTDLQNSLSHFEPGSEVSEINRTAASGPVKVSDDLWEILTACKKFYKETDGLFDITLKDFSSVYLHEDEKSVFFKRNDLSIDLGAYGKGLALENLRLLIEQNEVENALASFGNSSILALGHHPHGDCWLVNLENPFKAGNILDTFRLNNCALSVSGNMPSHPVHIINPVTGDLNHEKKVVAVICDNAAKAEVISTVLMIANDDQQKTIIKNFGQFEYTIFDNLN